MDSHKEMKILKLKEFPGTSFRNNVILPTSPYSDSFVYIGNLGIKLWLFWWLQEPGLKIILDLTILIF